MELYYTFKTGDQSTMRERSLIRRMTEKANWGCVCNSQGIDIARYMPRKWRQWIVKQEISDRSMEPQTRLECRQAIEELADIITGIGVKWENVLHCRHCNRHYAALRLRPRTLGLRHEVVPRQTLMWSSHETVYYLWIYSKHWGLFIMRQYRCFSCNSPPR